MNAIAKRIARLGQVHHVDAIGNGALLERLAQGGEQGARQRVRGLDGYVDVACGALRPASPGSEEVDIGGRGAEDPADDSLDAIEERGVRSGRRRSPMSHAAIVAG